MMENTAIPRVVPMGWLPPMVGNHRPKLSLFLRWSFYAFVFSLPLESAMPTLTRGYISIPRMVGIALVLSFFIDPASRPWKIPKPLPYFVAFLAIYFFGTCLDPNYSSSVWTRLFQMFQLTILLFISYNLFRIGQVTRIALLMFVLSCCVAVTLSRLRLAVNIDRIDLTGRLSAFGMEENQHCYFLALGVVLCIGITYVRLEVRPIPRYISLGIITLLFVGIAATGSRGGLLALMSGLATFALKHGTLKEKIRNVFILIFIASAGFYVLSRSELLVQRVTYTLETGSTTGRLQIWHAAWGMICQKPALGWGPIKGQLELAKRTTKYGGSKFRNAHNTLIDLFLITGMVGIIPYYLGLFFCLSSAWRARKGVENILPLAVAMTILGIQMSLAHTNTKEYWLFLGYLAASGEMVMPRALPMVKSQYSPPISPGL